MSDDGEVMRDEQIRKIVLALQIDQQIDHLAWIDTSSADTGSSHTIRLGPSDSARAMQMRWRWPPEN